MPRQVPLHPWEFPGEVWKRLHIDFAGPFMGHMFMLVVDAYSKWLEVFKMAQITSSATISRLRRLFASYGLPIVTDNATAFTSEEFQLFMRRNGILHTTGASRPPATNGLAERYVATFKAGMKKLNGEDVDDPVYLRNTAGDDPKWIPGVVAQRTGPVSYRVQGELTDQVYRRHGDQLRPRYHQAVSGPEPHAATQSTE